MRKIINLKSVTTYSNTEITGTTNLNETKWNYSEEFMLNEIDIPSEIVDKLIRLAAKWTNKFASDLLCDFDSLRRKFANIVNDDNQSNYLNVYFGFRKDGIDHKGYIELQNPHEYSSRYIEVWRLEIQGESYAPIVHWRLVQMSNYITENDMMEVEDK